MNSWLTKDNLTLVGAVIAAATGIANLLWQWKDRHDKILVRCGSLYTIIDEYDSLYVVNVGKTPVQLRNYGFVLTSGHLMSIPFHLEYEGLDREPAYTYQKGNLRILPSESFEVGVEYRGQVLGVWAITATQQRPRLAFFHATPLWKRSWLTLSHFVNPVYR